MPPILAPSLLASDFTRLDEAVALVDQSDADWLHLDVMDGQFVPNISFGMPIIAALRPLTKKVFDVHLMIERPETFIEAFHQAGADRITVHYEACPHIHRTLEQIRSTGAAAGVAINPGTPVSLLTDVLESADQVCVMSVNPGFGGQKFIYRTLAKVQRLKEEIITRNLATLIEVDGGVGLQNAEKIMQAGADVLVAGSSVYRAKDPQDAIRRFKALEDNPARFV